MDGATFDALVKRLTQTRLSRLEALRGVLATAVVGLTGASLAADTAAKRKRKGAGKKGGKGKKRSHDRHQKLQRQGPAKVTLCHQGQTIDVPRRRCRPTSGTATPWARVVRRPLDRRPVPGWSMARIPVGSAAGAARRSVATSRPLSATWRPACAVPRTVPIASVARMAVAGVERVAVGPEGRVRGAASVLPVRPVPVPGGRTATR